MYRDSDVGFGVEGSTAVNGKKDSGFDVRLKIAQKPYLGCAFGALKCLCEKAHL